MKRTLLLCLAALASCSDAPAPEKRAPDAAESSPSSQEAAPTPDVSHQETEVLFRCTDGSEFTATFGAQTVWLTENGEELELRQQPAGNGERYTGENTELIVRGDQAVLVSLDDTRDCSRLEEEQLRLPGSERGIDHD